MGILEADGEVGELGIGGECAGAGVGVVVVVGENGDFGWFDVG